MHENVWFVINVLMALQTVLIMTLGFKLFNLPLNKTGLIVTSILVAAVSAIFNYCNVCYILNLIGLILVSTVSAAWFTKNNLIFCFLAILLGLLIYSTVEIIALSCFLWFSGMGSSDFLVSPFMNIALFIPVALVVTLLICLIVRSRAVLFDFSRQGALDDE